MNTTQPPTVAEYDRLREQAQLHLTTHALFALLAGRLPRQNYEVQKAWDVFARAMQEEYRK